jgi:hypothetical protein
MLRFQLLADRHADAENGLVVTAYHVEGPSEPPSRCWRLR